jgi:hypothetical protein
LAWILVCECSELTTQLTNFARECRQYHQ